MKDDGEVADGRMLRGARNRHRILRAIYALVKKGAVHPTAEQVALMAGVGERTVFRHFADMESLHADMAAVVEAEVRPMMVASAPIDGPVQKRVRQLVSRRVRVYEHISPFRRAAAAYRSGSQVIQKGQSSLASFMRSEVATVLAPELRGTPRALLEALDMLASFEVWDRLRGEQRQGQEKAARIVETSILAVLAAR